MNMANISTRLKQRDDEVSERFYTGFKSMQTHVDASINKIVMTFNKNFENDIGQ